MTCFLIGDQTFDSIARNYLHGSSVDSHFINEIGKNFSTELIHKTHDFNMPFLSELISLEWRMVESFYDFSNILELKPDSQIWINPSLFFVQSKWPLDKIWQEQKAFPEEQTMFFSFTHMDRISKVLRASFVESQVLQILMETRSLEKCIENCEKFISDSELLDVFENSFKKWVEMGLISLKA